MTNKQFFAVFFLLVSPFVVWAANEVSVANSFTFILPSDSSEYTVLGGTFDSVTVNNTNFEFSMSAGSSIEITSADKKNFTVSPAITSTLQCETSQSRLVLSKGQGATTENVTVTPSGTCGSSGSLSGGSPGSVSTGGSSGGGGGGSSYSPPASTPTPTPASTVPAPVSTSVSAPASPTIATIQQQIAAIMARITALRGGQAAPPVSTTIPPAYGVFARVMNPGERSDEVHRLQQLLAQDPALYPEGTASGYYGTLTRNAVRRFQMKYGVISSENDLGNGRVGPKTRAKLNEIFGGSSAPVSPPPITPPVQQSAPAGTGNQAQINAIMQKIQEIQAKINALPRP